MAVQAVPSSVAQRIIIKFLTKEGVIPSEIFTRFQAQFGDECLSQPRAFSWAKSFREGRDHVENEPDAQRPRTSVNPDTVLKIGELIRANRRITLLELSQEVGISVGSVEEILHNELKVSRVSESWVPRLLSPEHKERRLVAVTQLLQRYEREGAEVLDLIVTCDETWVHYFTSESKRASKQWKHTHSPTPKKAKAICSEGKIMATVFWDSKGIIHLDFLTSQKAINAQYYSTLLNEKVKPAIRSKRRKRQDSVCFLQNNACPHTAALMMATLLKLKWDVLRHPPYSPDLAPSDYHLFGPLNRVCRGKRFRNNDEVIAAMQSWIHEQPKTCFETGIKKLPERWHKCIEVNRDYIEK
jgi:histone-lysine N-methyltransferase SETMAR